jgi:hypothetical protein
MMNTLLNVLFGVLAFTLGDMIGFTGSLIISCGPEIDNRFLRGVINAAIMTACVLLSAIIPKFTVLAQLGAIGGLIVGLFCQAVFHKT